MTKRPALKRPKGQPLLSTDEFFDLLRRRNPSNAREIDRVIEDASLRNSAILMVDSSGFTRKTQQYGILQFLSVMTYCYDRLIPIAEMYDGTVLSHGADNLFAVFPGPAEAVGAAVAMQLWLLKHNRGVEERDKYHVCMGIDCGPVLRLSDNAYGDHVNVAAKIGEDLAGKDEILVTRAVADKLRGRFSVGYDRSAQFGGRTVELFKVLLEAPKPARRARCRR